MDTNKVLYDYIVRKYGNVVNFSKKSGISLIDLNAALLKDNISEEIGIGFDLCSLLNIDMEEIAVNNRVRQAGTFDKAKKAKNTRVYKKSDKLRKTGKQENQGDIAEKNKIREKCVRLSELEKQKVSEYMDGFLEDIII